MPEELRGVIPIAYSTFAEDGSVDLDSFRRQIRTLVEDGCHGVAMFGLASEYYKLTDDERESLRDILVEECEAGDTPSVVSITHHATEVAVDRAVAAEQAGADFLMLLPPFFLGPSADDVYEHAVAVANAVSIPIVFQYAPDHTGVSLPAERLANLAAEAETITHFKIENLPPGPYISTLLAEADDVSVLIGRAGYQMIEAYDRGAVGVLPGAGYYDVYLEIEERLRSGDREGAISVHDDLLALLNHTTQNLEMAIAYGKRALRRRGIIDSAYCRRPSFDPDRRHDRLFESYYGDLQSYFE